MKGIRRLALLAACATACGRTPPSPPPPPADSPVPSGFDHVIVAIDTIQRGIALLRAATGVAPRLVEPEAVEVAARRAPDRGLGTQSALLKGNGALRSALLDLGRGRYLELVGIDPTHPDAARFREIYAPFRRLTLLAWAVRTPDTDTLRAALRSHGLRPGAIRSGERQLPAGGILRWRTLTPWENVSTMYPAFVEWAPSGVHPSANAPTGCTLTEFTLAGPDADSLRARLARAGVSATVLPAARQELTLAAECPRGRVELPTGAP